MKLLIVGEWSWEEVLLLLPADVIHNCEVCIPLWDHGSGLKYKGHPVWDTEPVAPLETLSEKNMRNAARVNECDMLIAFWDGRDDKVGTWITRAKISKKTTLIVYR